MGAIFTTECACADVKRYPVPINATFRVGYTDYGHRIHTVMDLNMRQGGPHRGIVVFTGAPDFLAGTVVEASKCALVEEFWHYLGAA